MRGVTVGVLGMIFCASAVSAQSLERFEFEHGAMGTMFHVVLYTANAERADRAVAAAFRRIDELNASLSDYDPSSELSRLSATAGSGQWVEVGADVWTVLARSNALAKETAGAFDVTIGPLTRLWRWANRRGTLPDPDRVTHARAAVGHRLIDFNDATKQVRLMAPGMRLDVGAVGKGFAADEALAVLRENGIRRAIFDAGGDIVAGDPPPNRPGWRIESPVVRAGRLKTQTSYLTNGAIATSGDAYRLFEADGVRYSHIVDPGTGLGLTVRRIVTVAAPTALEADALASAVSVLG